MQNILLLFIIWLSFSFVQLSSKGSCFFKAGYSKALNSFLQSLMLSWSLTFIQHHQYINWFSNFLRGVLKEIIVAASFASVMFLKCAAFLHTVDNYRLLFMMVVCYLQVQRYNSVHVNTTTEGQVGGCYSRFMFNYWRTQLWSRLDFNLIQRTLRLLW